MYLRQETGVPEGSPTVKCDGVDLAVSRGGSGPQTLVCLHAVGHGSRDYERFVKSIKGHFDVVCLDWPGHGRSGPDYRPPSVQRYAELLSLALDKLQVANPIIIGNSIGGGAAMLYASRRPVRGLVLCDSAGLVPVTLLVRFITGIFVRFFRAGARGARWYGRAFALYYRFIVLPSPAAAMQRERIVRAGHELAALLGQAWESFGRPEADLRAISSNLKVPIWFAWAKQDRVIPLWMCRAAINKISHAKLDTFKAGHFALLERPDEFMAGFNRFIQVSVPTD